MKSCPTWSEGGEHLRLELTTRPKPATITMEGEVKVTTPEGAGGGIAARADRLTFARRCKCSWDVRKPIRKHYRFS